MFLRAGNMPLKQHSVPKVRQGGQHEHLFVPCFFLSVIAVWILFNAICVAFGLAARYQRGMCSFQAAEGFCTQNLPPLISMAQPVK